MDLEIDGFTPIEVVGRGGSATVYRAREDAFDREVAIKVFDVEFGEADQERFARELRAIGRLGEEHHAVALVFATGATRRNKPYLSMRYYPGGSLQAHVRKFGPVALEDALIVADYIGGALDAAHEAGILHRDVKPANVLLDGKHLAVLADFGIAGFVGGAGETSTSASMMTPAYAPLERLNGEPATTASDIYSLTATLWSIIAGRVPHAQTTGDSVGVIMQRIVRGEISTLDRPDVPREVEQVLRRGLDSDPARRPGSAAELVSHLREAANQRLITSVPPWRPNVEAAPPVEAAGQVEVAGQGEVGPPVEAPPTSDLLDGDATQVKPVIPTEPNRQVAVDPAASTVARIEAPVDETTVVRGGERPPSPPEVSEHPGGAASWSRPPWVVALAAAVVVLAVAVAGALMARRGDSPEVKVLGTVVESTTTSSTEVEAPGPEPSVTATPSVTEAPPPSTDLPPDGGGDVLPPGTGTGPSSDPSRGGTGGSTSGSSGRTGGGTPRATSPPSNQGGSAATSPPSIQTTPAVQTPPPTPTAKKPPVVESISCKRGAAVVSFSPALSFTTGTHSFTFSDTSSGLDECTDESGRGITSGKLKGFALRYGQVNCLFFTGSGSGSGTIVWSNNTTSQATIDLQVITKDWASAPSGTVKIHVASGPYVNKVLTAKATLDIADRDASCRPTRGTLTFGAFALS